MPPVQRSLQSNGDLEVRYLFFPARRPQAAVILVHGMGGYSGRWTEMGNFLAEAGMAVTAVDLPGFGRTIGPRGHIDNFRKYHQVLNALVAIIKGEFPGKKVFLIGESMGGLVASDYCIHYQDQVNGLVLLSPAIASKLQFSWQKKLLAWIGLFTNPLLKINLGFRARMFTRDESLWARIDNDPLEVRVATPRFLFSIVKTMAYVRLHAEMIHLPALVMQAGLDEFVDPTGTEKFFQRLGSLDKTYRFYPDHFHALYLDRDRKPIFEEVRLWLQKHSAR